MISGKFLTVFLNLKPWIFSRQPDEVDELPRMTLWKSFFMGDEEQMIIFIGWLRIHILREINIFISRVLFIRIRWGYIPCGYVWLVCEEAKPGVGTPSHANAGLAEIRPVDPAGGYRCWGLLKPCKSSSTASRGGGKLSNTWTTCP